VRATRWRAPERMNKFQRRRRSRARGSGFSEDLGNGVISLSSRKRHGGGFSGGGEGKSRRSYGAPALVASSSRRHYSLQRRSSCHYRNNNGPSARCESLLGPRESPLFNFSSFHTSVSLVSRPSFFFFFPVIFNINRSRPDVASAGRCFNEIFKNVNVGVCMCNPRVC